MHACTRRNGRLGRVGLVLLTAAGVGLGGCAHQQRPAAPRDPYYYPPTQPYPGQGQAPSQVQYGHVRSIEQIEGGGRERREGSSGGGALVGGVIGGVVGNQMGSGNGRAAATVLGAVGGAIVGNEIERQNQRGERGNYEVQVQLERRGGDLWFQLDRLDGLKVGDRVRIENGRLQRW